MTFLQSNGHVGKPFSLPKVPGVCVKPQLFRGWRVQVATLKNYCRDLDLPFGDPRRAELLGIIERIEHHDQRWAEENLPKPSAVAALRRCPRWRWGSASPHAGLRQRGRAPCATTG